MLTMLVRMGRRVDLHSLKIYAGIGSRSHNFFTDFVHKTFYLSCFHHSELCEFDMTWLFICSAGRDSGSQFIG